MKYILKKYIDVAIGENEAGGIGKKPAPDEVNLALEQLDSTKAESIYVGDSDVDKATADNSQLDCVLCQWGFRDLELLESLKPKEHNCKAGRTYRSIRRLDK